MRASRLAFMQFNSLDYAVFLVPMLAAFWSLTGRPVLRAPRMGLVLVASCLFYMAWEPWYLGLILVSTCTDWLVARGIAASNDPRRRRAWLTVSVVVNLTLLGTFKYLDFVATTVEQGIALAGGSVTLPRLASVLGEGWVLPVGISFYTFESLSYCIDVYRGKCAPAKSPFELLFFITFFPKLVAGPIARPADLLPQLEREPRLEPERVGDALFLIGRGLVKKVAFADFIAVNLVERVFDTPEAYTAVEVVWALYGFTLQIFMDFSGYTDIARGSAKLFGIELPENFDSPYRATSPADFWRRWHMTLSTWLRDYLYFPLGGSKLGPVRTYLNLWITIFLIGLWHGASWTFVFYGTLQATAVVAHRFLSRKAPEAAPEVAPSFAVTALKVALTMQFVVFTRILFRADSLTNAGAVAARLFSNTWSMANVGPKVIVVMLLGFASHYVPARIEDAFRAAWLRLPALVQGTLIALLVFALMRVATSATVPYIYFQF